jgi:hypothetical protein
LWLTYFDPAAKITLYVLVDSMISIASEKSGAVVLTPLDVYMLLLMNMYYCPIHKSNHLCYHLAIVISCKHPVHKIVHKHAQKEAAEICLVMLLSP